MRPARTLAMVSLLALGVSVPGQVRAETATRDEMERVCRNWLSYVVHQRGGWAGDTEPGIAGVRELSAGDTLLALCFSIRPQGHVVVPILKELPPIKAYSEKHGIDPDQYVGYPQLLRDVLHNRVSLFIDRYGGVDATQSAKREPLFDPLHREQWDRFSATAAEFQSLLDGGTFAPLTEVGPLLTTEWHQFEPYNNLCPMGDGDRCVVGCMITAITQIMNYHEWPPTAVGTATRYWNGDQSCGGSTPPETLVVDLSDPYDWGNMPDSCYFGGPIDECTPIEGIAVAELCYEVGVAMMVDYGACGTGGNYMAVKELLPPTFKYSWQIDDEYREEHTAQSWFELIQAEINEGRPMLYLILGHAIVCDGWRDTGREQQYHMNYGWGGSYTGWYTVDHLHMSPNPMFEALLRRIYAPQRWTLEVEADGSGEFPTIQAAVDTAREGSVILLHNGVFTGEGNRDVDFLGKPLVIRSERGRPDSCVIDCEGVGRAFVLESGEGPGFYIEGIEIINGAADHGGAIYCDSTSVTIARCLFRDNSATQSGGAVYLSGEASPALLQCTFSHNSTAGSGAGIACDTGASLTVDHTIVAYSTAGEAVSCAGGATADLFCSDLYGNSGGDWVGCVAGQNGSDGNVSIDPYFCDPDNRDFMIAEDSPCAPDYSGPDCGLIGALGAGCAPTPVAESENAHLRGFALLANVPNPFNPVTEITYSIPTGSRPSGVILCVYNCLGQRVRTLLDASQPGGVYSVQWDGTDEDGAAVASGVYFCRLAWNGKAETTRMVLLK